MVASAAHEKAGAARQRFAGRIHDPLDIAAHGAQIAVLDRAVDIDDGATSRRCEATSGSSERPDAATSARISGCDAPAPVMGMLRRSPSDGYDTAELRDQVVAHAVRRVEQKVRWSLLPLSEINREFATSRCVKPLSGRLGAVYFDVEFGVIEGLVDPASRRRRARGAPDSAARPTNRRWPERRAGNLNAIAPANPKFRSGPPYPRRKREDRAGKLAWQAICATSAHSPRWAGGSRSARPEVRVLERSARSCFSSWLIVLVGRPMLSRMPSRFAAEESAAERILHRSQ